MAKKIVEIENLQTNFYTYEGVVRALNGINLTINYGSTFGLVGESGCGKSVTVRSIMRIIQNPGKIEGGSIRFFDDQKDSDKSVEILNLSDDAMREIRGNKISMIFQEPNAALNPIMSVGEQIAESYLFHSEQLLQRRVLEKNPKAKRYKNIPFLKGRWQKLLKKEALILSADIVGKLGIANPKEVIRRYPHEMSGGMKQRIVIAIALACNPLLLIADEATSNLDVTIQAQILKLLHELKKKKIISTILFITHDLGVVAETCDRVGVMYAGDIDEVADVADIITKPLHPYTKALVRAVPKLSQRSKLQSIEGSVPDLVHPPTGCRFHPRCSLAIDICKKQKPLLREIKKDHFVACFKVKKRKSK